MRRPHRIRALVLAVLIASTTACRRGPFPGDAVLNASGETPLMAAAMAGDVTATRSAIAARCDLERPWQHRTPLQWAVWYGHRDAALALLDGGADVDPEPSSRDAILLLAADHGSVQLFRDLLAHGARARRGPDSAAMLQRAARRGTPELVDAVLDLGFPVDGRARRWWDESPCTALEVACEAGNEPVVRALASRGADIGARTNDGWSPLHVAAGADKKTIVGALLELGADARATDAKGRTIVHIAAELGGESALVAIRERVSDEAWASLARGVDAHGRTPLHLAAWRRDGSAVRALVPVSDLDARTKSGWTPAHCAAFAGGAELTRSLWIEGAEPPRDRLGRTPDDLLARRESQPPLDPSLKRVDVDATRSSDVLVRWFHHSGFVTDPWSGHQLVVWADGTCLRRRSTDGATSEYRVGVLDAARLAALFDELRDTGLLARKEFESRTLDSSSEDLSIAAPDGARRYRVTNSLSLDGSDLELRAAKLECRRAFEVLLDVRAETEDALSAHLVDGAFRGIRMDRQRAPD